MGGCDRKAASQLAHTARDAPYRPFSWFLFLLMNCLSSLYSAPVFRRGWLVRARCKELRFLSPDKALRRFLSAAHSRA
nr:hypothetical protein RVX_0015 [Nitratidesulfovibrio sp. HK-II]